MKTNSHSSAFLHTFGGIVLFFGSVLVCSFAEAQAAVPLAPAARTVMSPAERKAARDAFKAKILEEEARAKVVLRAVGTVGGVPVAMVDVNDEPRVVMETSELVGRVAEIDVAKAQVTVRTRDGALRVFTLTEPRPVKFPGVTSQPESQERMMRGPNYVRSMREGIPSVLMDTWGELNREGKEAILMHYLQRGMVVSISSQGESSIGQLFEQQMVERTQARLQTFLANLTPEQRELFRGSAQSLVRIDGTPEQQAAQADRNRRRKANEDELLASLTPEQRTLYDAIRPKPETQ